MTTDTTTLQVPDAVEALPLVPTLRLLYTSSTVALGRVVHFLEEGPNRVGRDVHPSEGIRLDTDRRASRVHAVFHLEKGLLELEDLQSRNGTFKNGEKISRARLVDGDIVRIGDSFLLVRYESVEASSDVPIRGLLGTAPAMRVLRSAIAKVGPTEATVLLLGESGSGKEVVARAVHEESGRKGPFVAVNCSAIPEGLAESQLFGHVAGAFTGARGPNPGFFLAANGGTLFLDEVGELSPALQPKLLRTLEDRTVTHVGAVKPVPVDVRIVAATHKNLTEAVDQGTFRGDLLARLAALVLNLPPLRSRREDVLPLLLHGLNLVPEPTLSPDLVEALLLHNWPYNIRELLAVATELRIRGAGVPVLTRELVAHRLKAPPGPPTPAPQPHDLEESAEHTAEYVSERSMPTREDVEKLLATHRGRVVDIARATGRSRMQVYRWLERYGLDVADYRDR